MTLASRQTEMQRWYRMAEVTAVAPVVDAVTRICEHMNDWLRDMVKTLEEKEGPL